ncbi:MAG: glycosyltransferase [Ignavibacteriae bacterium]|nr:glycosyltransferase [Ignavibacteriota bacterium]
MNNLKETDFIKPLVSIVMPTYNRAKFIGKAIESILEQSYKNWELLVIDAISTDNTEEIIRKLNTKYSNIKYVKMSADDPKISEKLNFGINIASGKYISRLDDDDYWCDKDVLKLQINFLEENPDYVLVGGGVILVDAGYNELFKYLKKEKHEDIRKNALLSNPFNHCTVMFRKDTALLLNGFNKITFCEDWDFFLRLGLKGKFYNFQRYFTCYLLSGQNMSYTRHREQSKFVFNIIKRYKNHYPNYYKGLILNSLQYFYSFTPAFIKKRFHSYLKFFKGNYF